MNRRFGNIASTAAASPSATPLDGFQGVLRGVPTYIGGGRPLLEEQAS